MGLPELDTHFDINICLGAGKERIAHADVVLHAGEQYIDILGDFLENGDKFTNKMYHNYHNCSEGLQKMWTNKLYS